MFNALSSTFHRMIFHRIYRKDREAGHSSASYENDLLIADEESVRIIKQRINDATGKRSKSFRLHIADVSEGSFFSLAIRLRASGNEGFIETTQRIADRLAQAQTRVNIPDSYLIAIDATDAENRPVVVIIKAELQEAFTTSTDQPGGRTHLELLKDIFLSPASAFYKVGILAGVSNPEESYPNDSYACLIFDDQYSRQNKEPAEYFYKDFLGFTTERNNKIQTKNFYDDFREFALIKAPDADRRKELLDTLDALYIGDKTNVIDPPGIGNTFLDGALRDAYFADILTKPEYQRPFEKDTTLIDRSLKKKVLVFPGDINLAGPADTFDDQVRVFSGKRELERFLGREEAEGITFVAIKGKPFGD